MRRIVITFASTISALVLLFSYSTSLNRSVVATGTTDAAAATTTDGAAAPAAAATTTSTTTTYDGAVVSTQFGNVQVEIVVTDGAVTSADAIKHPNVDRQSQQINSYAVPKLNSEAVKAQSASIAMVSGATYTSQGYVRSLQDALDQAGL